MKARRLPLSFTGARLYFVKFITAVSPLLTRRQRARHVRRLHFTRRRRCAVVDCAQRVRNGPNCSTHHAFCRCLQNASRQWQLLWRVCAPLESRRPLHRVERHGERARAVGLGYDVVGMCCTAAKFGGVCGFSVVSANEPAGCCLRQPHRLRVD
jgi:hypothetical protein